MPDVEVVTIATGSDNATRVSQHGSAIAGEAPEVSEARATGRLIPMPSLPVRTLQIGKRTISEAARERIATLNEKRQQGEAAARAGAAAKPAEPATAAATPPAAEPAAAPEVKVTSAVAAPSSPAPATDDKDDDPDAPPGTPAAQAVKPAEAAAAPPPELAELRAMAERQAKMLAQYREREAEAAKAREADGRTQTDRVRFDEDAYATSPVEAFKVWLARSVGIKDAKDPKLDAEVDDFLADLTSHRMSVPLDAAYQAKRKSALLERAWELDKQRRTAGEQDAKAKETQAAQATQVEAVHKQISEQVPKDRYPNLHLAQLIDGKTPAQAVWAAIQAGVQSGAIDANEPDDKIIAKAASVVENMYRSRAESLRAALTPGTAAPPGSAPSGAADGVRDAKSRQGHGSRTITTADASVAPTTTQSPAPEARPRFKNDDERRRFVIKKHFPDHAAAKTRR